MTSSVELAARLAAASKAWLSLEKIEADVVAKARWEAINIVQWLARIANSFVTTGTPEDRGLLAFNAADKVFATKTFGEGLSLAMRLPTLELQFLENGSPVPHVFDPEEHSPAEVEAWLLVELLHRRVDRAKFSKKLPYKIPDLMSGDANDHSPQSCQQGLVYLTTWFQNAAAVLDATAPASGAGKLSILSRPQTLDLSWACGLGPNDADAGFSPGNAQNPEPYFYRSGPAMGSKGRLVLSASKLLAEADPAAAAVEFLKP